MNKKLADSEVILGNSNPRFSGVTSTMLQTLAHQQTLLPICVLGKHHLENELETFGVGFWQAVRMFRKALPSGKPRVFHARRNDEMIQALILKHVFRVKLKIVFTSTAQRHHSAFTRWLISKMDAVLSTCEAAASYLKQPPQAIIPHGIRSDIYFPSAEVWPKREITIGMFGRVREQKGSHLFVQAVLDVFPRHPNVKARIVGAIAANETDFVSQLQRDIDAAGLTDRIQFLGEQDFDQLPELFRTSQIVTALSRTEGFGLTVLEAMSSGAAVIATEAGAWPEVIENGKQGWVIPVGDLNTLISKLETLIGSPELIEQMGKAGRTRILEHYKVEHEAAKLCDVYRQLQDQE